MKHFETQVTITSTGRLTARIPNVSETRISEGRYPATIIVDEAHSDPTYEQPTRDLSDPDTTYGRNDLYATEEDVEESRQKMMYDEIMEDIKRVSPQTRFAIVQAALELLRQEVIEEVR